MRAAAAHLLTLPPNGSLDRLMSALNALAASTSARTAYYWTVRPVTGPKLLADCAQKIGIPDYPVRVKPDVTRDATSVIYTAAHYIRSG